jgi:hypothetical protein
MLQQGPPSTTLQALLQAPSLHPPRRRDEGLWISTLALSAYLLVRRIVLWRYLLWVFICLLLGHMDSFMAVVALGFYYFGFLLLKDFCTGEIL